MIYSGGSDRGICNFSPSASETTLPASVSQTLHASSDGLLPDEDPAPEDVPPVVFRRAVPMPSERVQFEHALTHIPYQAWCPVCVAARGRSDAHRRVSDHTSLIPQHILYITKILHL